MDRSLGPFVKWFIDHGGFIHDSAELAHDDGRGVYLRRKPDSLPISRGSKVVQCPHSLSLSAVDVFNKKRSEFSEEFKSKASPQLIGAAVLLQQAACLDQEWGPYIDMLPRDDFTLPLYYNDPRDRSWFQETNVFKGALDLSRKWREEFDQWECHSSGEEEADEDRGKKPRLQSDGTRNWQSQCFSDWSRFLWAKTVFASRAFPSRVLTHATIESAAKHVGMKQPANTRLLDVADPDVLLYPMIDAINHNPTTTNEWGYDAEGFWIVCHDEPAPGEEIFHSYGEKTNDQLFLSYGFVLADNPHDGFGLKLKNGIGELLQPFAIELLKSSKTSPETDHHWILPHGTKLTPGYPSTSTALRSIPITLLNFLCLLCSTEDELALMQEDRLVFEQKIATGELLDSGLRNRMEVVDVVMNALRSSLTRIEDAQDYLENDPQNVKQEIAKLYCTTQMKILTENIANLDAWLDAAVDRFETGEGSDHEH